jgi:hypothetical protein
MFSIILALFLAIVAVLALGELMIRRRGDCHLIFDLQRIRDKKLYEDDDEIEISFSLPIVNKGSQQGLLIDCKAQLQPEGDRYKNIDIHAKIVCTENPRRDDYWEAVIIKAGQENRATVILKVKTGTHRDLVTSYLERFIVDILFKYYGRNLMAYERCTVECALSSFQSSPESVLKTIFAPPAEAVPTGKGRESHVIPIKTHLLRPNEDINEVIRHYTSGIAEPGDIFTIAESALAIMQGRVYYVEDIRPRFLANRINKLFKKDSSLSSPYSLEMGIREVGIMRIILATILGVMGRAIGRSGDFYRIVGKSVATIDDCTGTLPPYDKCVVMGPVELQKTLESIKKNTGLEAAVVDVNDLKRVDILASTCPHHAGYLQEALINNPAGNANEQTPIVLIKAPERK